MPRGEKCGVQGTHKWEAATIAPLAVLDDSRAVGWGERAASPGKRTRGRLGCVEKGGGVHVDSLVSGLGNLSDKDFGMSRPQVLRSS